jgi:NitT/TauT family transport system substrate-binding protein
VAAIPAIPGAGGPAATPDALARVASGAADLAVVDMGALLRARDANPAAPKAIFIIHNKAPHAVVARRSRGIAQPADLEGKRLGAPPGEIATALWPLFAKANGIDPAKVKLESIAAPVREPMLAAGQIDAVTASALSAFPTLKQRGVPVDDLVVMLMADHGVPVYGDAIVVNAAFAAANPEPVKRFLRAYNRGLKAAIRNPTRAIDALMQRNDAAQRDVELARLRLAIRESIVTDAVLADGLGGADPERLAAAVDAWTAALKPKTRPEPGDLFDPAFLPPAGERRVMRPRD